MKERYSLPKQQLIALNGANDLSRDSICKLAFHLDRWTASRETSKTLGKLLKVPPSDVQKARQRIGDTEVLAQLEIQAAANSEVDILTLLDEQYPAALRHLELPPPVLYCRGQLPDLPSVAIVGSRQATQVGLEAAELFGRELAACGLVVVSGFARGIDLAAHRGAMQAARGRTVAVLGCGLDFDYPKRRRRMRQAIPQRGALISEFPLRARPAPVNFPIRNRIIAALSIGTLVVQGTPQSGSLITARLALDLGRDVYAVPGSIFDRRAAGPNSLIRDGAQLVQRPQEILESLPVGIRDKLPGQASLEISPLPTGPAGAVLQSLDPGQVATADALAESSGVPLEQIHALLLELELAGYLRRLPGATYCRRA